MADQDPNPIAEVSITTLYNMEPEDIADNPEAIARIEAHLLAKIEEWRKIKEKKRLKKADDPDLSIFKAKDPMP